jgi:hypothetical protein
MMYIFNDNLRFELCSFQLRYLGVCAMILDVAGVHFNHICMRLKQCLIILLVAFHSNITDNVSVMFQLEAALTFL